MLDILKQSSNGLEVKRRCTDVLKRCNHFISTETYVSIAEQQTNETNSLIAAINNVT